MKKFISALAIAAFLTGPVMAEEISVTVEIPVEATAEAQAEATHTALLAAAQEVCDQVEYVGISRFYTPSLKKECVSKTYDDALAQDTSGRLLASLEQGAGVAAYKEMLN
ncbi:hypothetical protein [Ponticaulis profundi]|uniref:UrcA family protein n=1 Tax=Ponticaulis profundi TaxID=2665222 RepID=A0ABW1SBI6_9PROT